MMAINRAIELVGGPTRMAEIVGVSVSFVSQWANGTRPIPATRCAAIERATGGEVKREDLRPDVFSEQAA